jgi:hypothetical protein
MNDPRSTNNRIKDKKMYTYECSEITEMNEVEIAFSSTALFEQYDDANKTEAANDDCYDNLYPFIA